MNPFRYAVNTNQMRNQKTTAEIVDIAVAAGVDGIEWGLRGMDDAAADVREMNERTRDAGLDIVGFLNAGHLWQFDELRRWSDALADCPSKTLRVGPPWFAWDYNESLHQQSSYLDHVERTKAALPQLQTLAREYGIKYVMELHCGSIAASPWAMRDMLDDIDPACVGVIYDPANMVLEGFIRPRGACELLGDHLAYVHAKNLAFAPSTVPSETPEPRRMQWQMHRTFLDQGMVDYVEVYFALKCAGFSGWVSLEEFVTDDPVREMIESLRFLKACDSAAPAQPCEPFSCFPSP